MNNFILQLIASLSKTKSKQQIKSDVKSLGDMYVKLIGNLDMPKTRKAIKAQLKGLNNFTFNITPNVNTKGVQSATKQVINNAQRVASSNKVHLNFDTSKQQLINMIKIVGKNNNKLFNDREMTAKYNQLLNSANVAKSTGELKTLKGELAAFKTELVATNNAGLTWGSKFKKSIESYAKFFSGASMIYALFNQVRNAATEAKALDDSLVNLQKVTDEIGDRDTLYKYFDKSLSKAQELNVKVGSLIDAVTEFKKLGWDLDDAELGAKWANILSNVGDTDIETAIGSIKTSIASFDEIGGYGNDQMDKKLEAYTDLINNMSNKYSIDAEGLAESIRLSAGTLTEAHMSIEQAATMFATANKYYNDPSYLGNTAKIGSLRMRASSGDTDAIEELQEMGEEVDDLATATSNLRENLMALTGVDIMQDKHTFKSYYDQLYEISQVIDKLDDTSRANVLETMFGKNRAAAGAAILSGMKESASVYEDAINSAGSATEEYQTWMQSADAACQRFSNTLTETYQGIINGNTVRDLANLGSAVLEFANNWGIVEGTLKGVIALGIGKFLTSGTMALITATKQVEQYGKALQMASNVPNGNLSARFKALKSIAQATSTLTTEQLRNVLATNTLTQADCVRILQMQGITKEMALQKLAEMNLTQATNAQTVANTASTASTFSLKAAMIGLGATLKSVFLSNPVGIVLMGISLGVSAVTSAVSKHNQAVEEARQKAKEAADNANTLGNEIAELSNKYIQLSDAVKTDASAKEDLMTTQTELLKKLGLEGESIDDLIAKYGSLSNAIKQASIDSLKDQQIDLIAGVNAAKEELMDVAKDNFWGTSNIISASGDEAVKAFKELEKAGVIDSGSYGTGGGQLVLIGDETVEGALENYKKLEDAVNALRDSEAFTADELSDNSLFNSIYSRYSEMKESVEAYNSSIDNLNENLAQQTMLTALQGNELPETREDFNKFKQELIDTAVASKQFIGNEEEITDAINNYLSTVPEFEGYYSIPLENELNKVDELLNQENFSKTTSFKSLWKSIGTGSDDTSKAAKEEKENLLKLAEQGKLTDKVFKKSSIAQTFTDAGFSIAEATKKINNLVDSSKRLSSLKSSIKSIQDAFAEKRDNKVAGADTLSAMEETFGSLKSWKEYKETLGSTTSNLNACREAQNKLVTEYINTNNFMSDLVSTIGEVDEKTKQYYISQLKDLGIKNAEEVVNQEILKQQIELRVAKLDFANATDTEISGLINEVSQLGDNQKAIKLYTLQKALANKNSLSTADSVANLVNLAKQCGATAETIAQLISLQSLLANIDTATNYTPTNMEEYHARDSFLENAQKQADLIRAKVKASVDDAIKTGEVDNSGTDIKDPAKSKNKNSKSSSSKSTNEFNWIDTLIDRTEKKAKRTVDSITDYANKKSKNKLYDKAIKRYKNLGKIYQQTSGYYLGKFNNFKISKNAKEDASWKNKIQNGDFSIDKVKNSKKADKITKAKEYYDQYQNYLDKEKDNEKTLSDLRKQRLDDDIAHIEAKSDRIQRLSDSVQNRIDYNDVLGLAISKNSYKELIKYSKKQVKRWIDEKATYSEYLSTLKRGSTEYIETEQKIADCDSKIQDAKKSQLEWNQTIAQMPLDKFEKLGNVISSIITNLGNFNSLLESQGKKMTSSQILNEIGIRNQSIAVKDQEIAYNKGERFTRAVRSIIGGKYNWVYGTDLKEYAKEADPIADNLRPLFEKLLSNEISLDDFYSKASEQTHMTVDALKQNKELNDILTSVPDLESEKYSLMQEQEEYTDKLVDIEISKYQELRDEIEKANDAKQKALELTEKEIALQKELENRTNLIYRNGKYVYEFDSSAVREKQNDLDNYYAQQQLDKLDDIIDKLGDLKNTLNYREGTEPIGDYKTNPSHLVEAAKRLIIGITGEVKGAYASGTTSAKGGLSLVGEKGTELRVLNRGDGIIPAEITKNLMEFGVDPAKMITDNLNKNIPDYKNIITPVNTSTDNSIHIDKVEMSGVNDVQSFMKELSHLTLDAQQRAYKR